ncbi:RNA polymerase sigma-70 factor [Marivirga sp. S37H4]|uniref:RNA polymerase sigma-70 factor n=1 Tax=Marivirga aurantiaca TaxID=2802615 RepID=A0A935C8F9_9BACT|nr:RNA polymerase sigma-70 factor [Marivirga aurantiaca]MBK6265434.1 RNA polymerase sigma-70 factor [Marivirga aurantiaca]
MKIIALQTDLQLIMHIKNDDEQALKVLFDRYFNSLCQFSFQITHHQETTEEVVADIFIELWRRRAYIQINHQVKAFLFKMVKNASLNALRNYNMFFSFSSSTDFEDIDESPEDKLISEENVEGIMQILNILPPAVKSVFLLQREEGFTYAEIAEILKISVKTVESHMGKALKLMREAFQKSSYKEYYHK